MKIYMIKRGIMKQVPQDSDFKQVAKYVLAFVVGMVIGNFWPYLQ